MHRPHPYRLARPATSLLLIAATLLQSTPLHASAPALTDDQVVASMKKAIDYLLKQKKTDNWEADHEWPGLGPQKGGLTALVLYSLLHAAQSLQDESDYQAKLNVHGEQLAPAIAWLSKNDPQETYTAGLQASALALLTKRPDDKPGEGHLAGLEKTKNYLVNAMGVDGGYTYSYPGASKGDGDFKAVWERYFAAKLTNDKAAADKARGPLDAQFIELKKSFGGVDKAIQRLVADLRARRKTDAKDAARLDKEIAALQTYYNTESPKPNFGKGKFLPVGDLSNGQYGTLGAWALMDYGIELPNSYWTATDKFWRITQKADGTWPYAAEPSVVAKEEHPALTVAGIASLFVAQEFVDTQLRSTPVPDKNIDLGLAWLNKNFTPDTQDYYYLYGVERVGLSSGLKFFGTTDWYKQSAAAILKYQNPAEGFFDGKFTGGEPIVATAYAILFLARGRNPVVFNKLQYNGPWNARPRDSAYVTRWMSNKRFEKPINWQVVNLQVPAEEWLDAPILLITGSTDPRFTADDLAKLRNFINAGGMIFSTADGNSAAFTAAMQKYAADVVDKKFEMRQLPQNHHLFSKGLGVELPNPPALLGMSNGIRDLWIHSTVDVGATWQTRKFATKDHFELAAALYLYATGMGTLRSKLQPLTVTPTTEQPQFSLDVARLDYPGNADPEPGAWARLAKLARANYKTDVRLATVKFADLDPRKHRLAVLTGTAKTTFADPDVQALKSYLDKGGTLLAEAAGGSPEFAESLRQLCKQIYPEKPLADLPPDHPLYTGAVNGGQNITEIQFRKFGNLKLGRTLTRPALQAVIIDNRPRIIFSEYDISSGFLGTKTWGIVGYAPASSEALAKNLLLHLATR